jgi:hypothetical protein
MLRNLFGSHVPSDLLLLEDAQSMQIKKNWAHWQHAALNYILLSFPCVTLDAIRTS